MSKTPWVGDDLGIGMYESRAWYYLRELGWKPRKTTIKDGLGIPDFKCTEKRWVEAKNPRDKLSMPQIKKISELNKSGEEVYLAIVNGMFGKKDDVELLKIDITLEKIETVFQN